MDSSTEISSSSSIPTPKMMYDVFLSFRGKETRLNFTDNLHQALYQKGILTFKDDKKLESGKEISSQLLKAIEQSRFAIVILSKMYATSPWCLDELVKIVECCEVMKQIVVFPVFYNVDTYVVRHQAGDFKDAFLKHEINYEHDLERVSNWKKALTTVANFSGWDVNSRKESEVIVEIVTKISNLMNNTFLSVNNNLVGMDAHLEKLDSLLDIKLDDVRTLGIWGMGGIGKTTIVQEVFKRIHDQFEACCFLADVREESKKNSLVDLQKNLYKCLVDENVKIPNVDVGINILRRRLSYRKVLIILDDVDELKQMESLVAKDAEQMPSLGRGSRVIITTRDKHLLKGYGVNNIYEVKKLGNDEALKLLCQKAFKSSHPSDSYKELSKNFVKYASGLPLALEVLGSFLSGRTEDEWSDALDRSRTDPESNILGPLQLSYSGLKDTEKKMFLDIACFFKGFEIYRVKKIFESCGFHPSIGISVLMDKCLIKIERDRLSMHDLLQQMGWHIIRQESPTKPGERSRLWFKEDAYNVVTENTGTDAVEGILLSLPEEKKIHLNFDPFSKMHNLRLLMISKMSLSGCFTNLCKELRVLEWPECPLESMPPSFRPYKLVELHMPGSRFQQLWNEAVSLKMLVRINLSYCQSLIKTPDFRYIPNVEILILEGCKSLSKVDQSIGQLRHIKFINLKGCESLTSFSSTIDLKSLRFFVLSGCSNLNHFPKIMGNMQSLIELYLDGTAIQELPESTNHLTSLFVLDLSDCKNLVTFPTVICSLTSLKALILSGCPSIHQLPENLGNLEHLLELDFRYTAIRKVPSSITLLKNLEKLSFQGCKGEQNELSGTIGLQLPASFSGLCSLIVLDLSGCNLAEGAIPDDIGCLSSLQYLYLSENNFESIPESIFQLSELKELYLNRCSNLQSVPNHLPPSLKYLHANDCNMLSTFSNDRTCWISSQGFSFIDCRKSNEDINDWKLIPISDEHLDVLFPKYIADGIYNRKNSLEICFPYTRIPDWCSYSSSGSSITVQLTPEEGNSRLIGISLFVIFEIHGTNDYEETWELDKCLFHFNIDHGCFEHPIAVWNFKTCSAGSYGLCLYYPQEKFVGQLSKARQIGASFSTSRPDMEVKWCGMHLVLNDYAGDYLQHLAHTANEHLEASLRFCEHCKTLLDGTTESGSSGVLVVGKDPTELQSPSTESPHEAKNRSSDSTVRVGTDLKSLLSRLFEVSNASGISFYFAFPHPVISRWFFHHCVGDATVCYLPDNISDDKNWVGLELYALISWDFSVSNDEIISYLLLHLFAHGSSKYTLLNSKVSLEVNRCHGPGQFIIVHLPRLLFGEELNHLKGISALFRTTIPNMNVAVCGTRLVYEQDLEDLTEAIMGCTKGRSDTLDLLYHQVQKHIGRFAMEKSFHEVDESAECNVKGKQTEMSNDCYSNIQRELIESLQKLLAGTEDVAKQVSTLSLTYASHLTRKQGYKESDPIIYHSKRYALDSREHIQAILSGKGPSSLIYHHFQVMVENLLYENKNIDRKITLRSVFPNFKDCALVTFSLQGHIIAVKKHFDPFFPYNFCFPQKEILDWFKIHSDLPWVQIELPSELYDDNNWKGLVLCAAFSVNEHPTATLENLDSDESFKLLCHLRTNEYCLNPVPTLSVTREKFSWLHVRGFIWLTYIPKAWLTELNAMRNLEARIYCSCPNLMLNKFGIRLMYEQNVVEFEQAMMGCLTSFVDKVDLLRLFVAANRNEKPDHANNNEGETSGASNDTNRENLSVSVQGLEKDLDQDGIYNSSFPENEKANNKEGETSGVDYIKILERPTVSVLGLQAFNPDGIYNNCFSGKEIPEWFRDQNDGNSVTIQLPSTSDWTGLGLCAYFAHNQDPKTSHDFICLLETCTGCLESLEYKAVNKEYHSKKEDSFEGGFIWVSYIPRWWISDNLDSADVLEASFASRGVWPQQCGFRPVYLYEEDEFRQQCMCMTSLPDDTIVDNKCCNVGEESSTIDSSVQDHASASVRTQRSHEPPVLTGVLRYIMFRN